MPDEPKEDRFCPTLKTYSNQNATVFRDTAFKEVIAKMRHFPALARVAQVVGHHPVL